MRDDLIAHARAQHRAYAGTDLGAYWQGYEAGVDALHAVLTAQGETAPAPVDERRYRCLKCGAVYSPVDWCPNGHGADTHSDVMQDAQAHDRAAAAPLPAAEGLEEIEADMRREADDWRGHPTNMGKFGMLMRFADRLAALLAVAEGRR